MDSYTVGDPIFLIFTTLMQFMHICLQFTHFFLWCTKSRDLRVLGAKKNWILGCEPKKQNFQPCQRFLIFWAIFGDSPRPIPRYQTKADLNCWTPGCYLCWCWCFLTSFFCGFNYWIITIALEIAAFVIQRATFRLLQTVLLYKPNQSL